MYQELNVVLTGVSPLMCHNARLCNPMDALVKQIKVLTSKRKKTDEDLLAIARLEFEGGLYLNAKGAPILPGLMIESCVVNGAKKSKKGTAFKSALFCGNDPEIKYPGPKTVEELWAAGSYTDTRPVVVQRSKLMRTRPIFKEWSIAAELQYDSEQIDLSDVLEAIKNAGVYCALGDYRPRFGRFEMEEN